LDADMILAAQAGALVRAGDETVVVTTKVRQLASFAAARIWRETSPKVNPIAPHVPWLRL
jgi:hypothetical protein